MSLTSINRDAALTAPADRPFRRHRVPRSPDAAVPGTDRGGANRRRLSVGITAPPLIASALGALIMTMSEFVLQNRGAAATADVHLVVASNPDAVIPVGGRECSVPVGAICLVVNGLSDTDRIRLMEIARCRGVRAFVTLDDEARDLRSAMLSAARGERYCSPRITPPERTAVPKDVVYRAKGLASEDVPGCASAAGKKALSERQTEVAQLARDGLSNQEIADRLFIDVTTVKSHLTEVYLRLGIRRRSQIQNRIVGRTELPDSARIS